MGLVDTTRMDKTAFSVGTLDDEGDEKAYWVSKTPEERLAAVELMRQIAYGYDPSTTRLQRVLSVISVEDLQRNKRAAARLKDLNDLENLP